MIRKLPHEVALVRAVERLVSEPLRVPFITRKDARVRRDLVRARVLVAATLPLVAHSEPVPDEGALPAAPHTDSRVVAPATTLVQGLQELQHLDPLLAEPLAVERLGGLYERWIRKKRLHSYTIARRSAIPSAFIC